MALLMNSCSWLTYLGIRNDSSESINIKYTLNDDIKGIFRPKIVNNSDIYKIHKIINSIPFADYNMNDDNMEITAILNPQQTLIIENELNFHGYYQNMQWFPIKTITITTSKGNITYSGNEVINAFKEIKRTIWVIQYQ